MVWHQKGRRERERRLIAGRYKVRISKSSILRRLCDYLDSQEGLRVVDSRYDLERVQSQTL